MTVQFNMTRDINGYNGFGLPFSDQSYNTTLAADAEQTLTVPYTQIAGMSGQIAVFSFAPGASVWVSLNATATSPSSSFAQTDSELNPAARLVQGGDILHFITSDVSDQIGVSFYAAP